MPHSVKELSGRIMQLARKRRATLATVESCTAGSLAYLLSQAEGASDTLHGGFVVYTKANKMAAVGVPQELLTAHTAVSTEVAQAMAIGGLARCPADFVVSITGVAGPDPDEDGNRVGLVYVAAAASDGRSRVARHEFGKQDKAEICAAAMGRRAHAARRADHRTKALLKGSVPCTTSAGWMLSRTMTLCACG
jgi:nicotinamide-nucleotide amidase